MPHTQKLIIISLALIAGIGLGFILSKFIVTVPPAVFEESPSIPVTSSVDADFKLALMPLLETRFGTTTSGYNSHQLLYVYPGIKAEDFNTVQTIEGSYQFRDGYLWHTGSSTDVGSQNLTDAGYVTLSKNIRTRLALAQDASSGMMIASIGKPAPATEGPTDSPSTPPSDGDTPVENPEEPTMCPMDARMCSDGSFVGRTAPGCAFAACPDGAPPTNGEILCTPEQREAEACIEIYAPVCASYQVQCITEPCNPVPKSYPNSCFACADNKVISYTEGGVCASDPLSSE